MGIVYLVGAGPGDPGLITIKGKELLQTCDVVIYDRLASFQLLEYLKDDCVKIYVGKESGHHSKTQEEINRIIVEHAQQYECVVRLKGGDSFVFGRGGEEIEELLKYNIYFEVIPGVTSAISVPESVGIPVTHRGLSQSFHVITGHTGSGGNTLTENYETLSKLDGTLVFLMGLSNLSNIVDKLVSNGKDISTPAAVISNGTMNNEKTVRGTLADIVSKVKAENVLSPAIIIIGNTAKLDFSSKIDRPLLNLKVGITGTKEIREKLEQGLSRLGAKTYSLCNMHIVEAPSINELKEELLSLEKYQWVLFTSKNAIKIFFDKLEDGKIDRRRLNHIQFAVIGIGTKQTLQKYGYFADFVPSKFNSISLAVEFSQFIRENEKVLIPRALRGSEELTDILNKNKIQFKEIFIYDVQGKITENSQYITKMDCLAFASASGVSTFFEGIKEKGIELPADIKIACLGDVTAEAVKKFNRDADIIADVNYTDGLIESIEKFNWK